MTELTGTARKCDCGTLLMFVTVLSLPVQFYAKHFYHRHHRHLAQNISAHKHHEISTPSLLKLNIMGQYNSSKLLTQQAWKQRKSNTAVQYHRAILLTEQVWKQRKSNSTGQYNSFKSMTKKVWKQRKSNIALQYHSPKSLTKQAWKWRKSNSTRSSNILKPLTEQAWKRHSCANEQCGHYHRGVPENFEMMEHGPEIHLDIDECGSRVDTHPAALSLHTETAPHEHCCHHCYHECQCCSKRNLDDVEHHHDDYGNEPDWHHDSTPYSEISPIIIQHTPDIYPNGCANGDCRSSIEQQECYGARCRDHFARMPVLQNQRLFQYSEHADRIPLHSVYEEPMIPQYQSTPQLMAQSLHHEDENHRESQYHFNDTHSVGHIVGQTRDTVGVDTPVIYPHEKEVPDNEEIPRLITFGETDNGIAMTDGDTVHSIGQRVLGQSNIAFKRSHLKDLKRSKRCKR